jgi:hypothetical protein
MAITHDIHDGKGGKRTVKTTPIKAIRLFCRECMGYQQAEITRCSAPLCPLFPYKMKNAHSGKSEEYLKTRSEYMKQHPILRCATSKVVQESTIVPECIG